SGLSPSGGHPPTFAVLGHLDLGVPYPFVIELNVGDPNISLRGGDHGHTLSIATLLRAVGLDPAVAVDLPPGLASIGLSRLAIDIGLAPLRIDRLGMTITSATPLSFFDDVITFEPVIDLDVADPFGPQRKADVTIAGGWSVGDSVLDVSYSPTSGALAVGLHAGQWLDVDAFLAALLPGGPTLQLALPDLRLSGNTTTGAFSVRLDVEHAITFPIGPTELSVDDVVVRASRAASGSVLQWELQGSLAVAGVHLLVRAERTAGSDWRIDARGTVDDPIDLGDLVREALARFNPGEQGWPDGLPAEHATIGVRQLVLQHDTADRSLQLYADLDMDIAAVHGIAFTHLTSAAEFDDKGLVDAWVEAGLVLGGVPVALESRFDAANGLVFSGESADGASIPIGRILADVAHLAGVDDALPAAIADLVVDKIGVSYRTLTKDLSLRLEADLPGATGIRVNALLELAHSHQAGASVYTKHVHGEIVAGELHFDVDFSGNDDLASLVGRYTGGAKTDVPLAPLVARVDRGLAAALPSTLSVGVREILLVHQRAKGTSRTIFALALAGDIDLSGLPLIGRTLGTSLALAFEPIIASADYSAADLGALRPLLQGPIELPADGIDAGIHLESRLTAGDQTWRLGLPIALSSAAASGLGAGNPPASTPTPPAAQAGNVKWFAIGKNFGPAYLQRVGLGFENAELSAALDGSLTLGPLTLELMGLTVAARLDDLVPRFGLRGLALDYHDPEMEIGGAFLHQQVDRNGVSEDEYAGEVVIKTSSFALSAIGSYSEHEGHPSLFVYAVLNRPIGGPTCFFVTGLAAGFGYNRELILPPVEGVANFPLIQEATGTVPRAASLGDEMARLGSAIPPSTGAMFAAAGIKFNSFKIIDSFVMVAVQFGRQVEIDVLGVSRAVVPPPQLDSATAAAGTVIPPLAQLELAIRARFLPDTGALLVRGQLTPASYLLSENCRLQGGFAFAAWFGPEHKGDFVATLGGYHPSFVPELHYPTVPRLGFTWPVTPSLRITGDVYFALTPSALMAGGHLEMTWHEGALEAWFRAGIDFLMAWKPYHYEARMYVQIGGSYTFEAFGTQHVTVQVGAELELWGPEFAGLATIDLGITSVTARFGPQVRPKPIPLDWAEFSGSFLPAADEVCTITVAGGLLRTIDGGMTRYDVVDPARLDVRIQSRVPMNADAAHPTVAIGPMGVTAADLRSAITVNAVDEDGDDAVARGGFIMAPVTGSVPAALWGSKIVPDLHDPALVEDVVIEYRLTATPVPAGARSSSIPEGELAFETTLESVAADATAAADPPWVSADDWDIDRLTQQFTDHGAAARRHDLIRSLRIPLVVSGSPNNHLAEQLMAMPLCWRADEPAP
ncbi:MAG: hypothetical protein QOG64_1513, partial [Acidimicrobiaceae bacterium]|nr:hypothetical protein [Acidimicrobiaceae bacterium]